ncbi:MAG: hypothetical protein V1905_00670 [bacterium]
MEDKKDDKRFSELIEYLDSKFTAIDDKFFVVNETLALKADKSDVSDLLSAVDAYAKKADT